MDRITLPNGITIESSATANDQISKEAFDLLNTYSAESILEAFVACESAGLFSTEAPITPERLKLLTNQRNVALSKLGKSMKSNKNLKRALVGTVAAGGLATAGGYALGKKKANQ